MGARDPSQEASSTPDPVEKSLATLNTLRIGVKAFVEKVRVETEICWRRVYPRDHTWNTLALTIYICLQDGGYRKAEILSMRQRKDGPGF
ncbi:hypothetical protein PRK78_003243 [Emydomyces testavorans]|uniref:Uncharacterized protein n=1 Tax=Emydomyces testavorans TaxID=2070801 RepID=A0AAF0IIK7_9EURO|nr:hypothetical protein PRK78_003243 [Emydomyces testavorans]